MSIHDIKTGSFEEGLNKIYSMILINSNYTMDFDEEAISYFRDFFDEHYGEIKEFFASKCYNYTLLTHYFVILIKYNCLRAWNLHFKPKYTKEHVFNILRGEDDKYPPTLISYKYYWIFNLFNDNYRRMLDYTGDIDRNLYLICTYVTNINYDPEFNDIKDDLRKYCVKEYFTNTLLELVYNGLRNIAKLYIIGLFDDLRCCMWRKIYKLCKMYLDFLCKHEVIINCLMDDDEICEIRNKIGKKVIKFLDKNPNISRLPKIFEEFY